MCTPCRIHTGISLQLGDGRVKPIDVWCEAVIFWLLILIIVALSVTLYRARVRARRA